MDESRRYDVIVLGGGLAGLSLTLQLLEKKPAIRILVLEKNKHPVAEAAFKVGESTVELGAHYFAETLGLKEHLLQYQLPKFGLRFFFTGQQSLTEGLEIGLKSLFETPSYQIDRGRFENFLGGEIQRRGAHFLDSCAVADITLGDSNEDHTVTYTYNDAQESVTSKWVVDASGRAGILKKKLGLAQAVNHRINAAWFRLKAPIKIDDWCQDARWQTNGCGQQRWLSTNHLMGPGYWVWLIPLASGSTSVGIVADPRFHPLSEYNRFDRALEWLRRHEPLCATVVEEHADLLQDFKALKNFSYGCKQVFSNDRWALTGEAGVFLDPFYSPGSDFIAMGNTYITQLIDRDLRGKSIKALVPIYENMYMSFFENTLRAYEDQYQVFGDGQVMPVKIVWDYAVYWTLVAFLFFNERLHDTGAFVQIRTTVQRATRLNEKMQRFFQAWHGLNHARTPAGFVDQGEIGYLYRLNHELQEKLDTPAFRERLLANSRELERLSAEISTRVIASFPELAPFSEMEREAEPTDHLKNVFANLQV